MDIITAAKRRLQRNTNLTSSSDPIVELRHNGVPYYRPKYFHLSWTLTRPVNLAVRDLRHCCRVSAVYRHIGTHLDTQGTRLLGNWPLRTVRVVGRVTSIRYIDDHNTQCRATIDDGTAENDTLAVYTDAKLAVGTTVEVVGVLYRHDAVKADTVQRVWLTDQIAWWSQMLNDREMLQQQWVLEDTPSFSTELELVRETEHHTATQQPPAQPLQVIDLELPDMRVVYAKGEVTLFEDWLYTIAASTPAALHGRVMYALVADSATAFTDIYNAPPVRTLLNRLLLDKFVTNAVPLSDELIYAEWSRLRLQDSKRVLLRTVLADLGVHTDDPPLTLHTAALTTATEAATRLFNTQNTTRVHLTDVKALLPDRASSAATVSLVAGLVKRGLVNDTWVYSMVDKTWMCMP